MASELLALLDVTHRAIETFRRRAERAGGDVEPSAVEPGHGDLEALALGTEPVRHRHPGAVEDDGGGGLGGGFEFDAGEQGSHGAGLGIEFGRRVYT